VFVFLDNWHDIVPREGGHVVALFGGGGKTALLEVMTAALHGDDVPVCVTTTTRTETLDWPDLQVVEYDELSAGAVEIGDKPVYVRSGVLPAGDGAPEKWLGLSIDQADSLGRLLPDHVVLVEADGSAGHPVKLHRDDEPVLPARTSLAVPVIGLSSVGMKPEKALHRLGRLPDEYLGLTPDEPWNWDNMKALLSPPAGYLGRIPAGVPVLLALLQMDECDDAIGLFSFAGQVMEELNLPVMVMGDTSGPEPRLKTACLPDPEGDDE